MNNPERSAGTVQLYSNGHRRTVENTHTYIRQRIPRLRYTTEEWRGPRSPRLRRRLDNNAHFISLIKPNLRPHLSLWACYGPPECRRRGPASIHILHTINGREGGYIVTAGEQDERKRMTRTSPERSFSGDGEVLSAFDLYRHSEG